MRSAAFLIALLPALAFAQSADGSTSGAAAQAGSQSSDATNGTSSGSSWGLSLVPEVKPIAAPTKKAKPISAAQQKKQTEAAQREAGDTAPLAKDIGPLKDRIPPVTGHLFLMRKRLELTPMFAVSLKDAFFTKYGAGAELTYHISEAWGVGLRGTWFDPVVSGSAQICTYADPKTGTKGGCRSPTMAEESGTAPGQISLLTGLDAQWAPIYGKLALWAESFLHFDLYGRVGLNLVQYVGSDGGGGTKKQLTPGATLGLGLRFFINRWMTARFELSDLLYREKLADGSQPARAQLFFQLGISFFFPMSFSEG